MAQYDDLDNRQIFAYSAIFVVGTVITIMFVAFVFHWMEEGELERKMLNTEYTQYDKILEEQTASLNEYVYRVQSDTQTDPDTEESKTTYDVRYGVPIETAIETAVNNQKQSDAGKTDKT